MVLHFFSIQNITLNIHMFDSPDRTYNSRIINPVRSKRVVSSPKHPIMEPVSFSTVLSARKELMIVIRVQWTQFLREGQLRSENQTVLWEVFSFPRLFTVVLGQLFTKTRVVLLSSIPWMILKVLDGNTDTSFETSRCCSMNP
jgi:hypothetical protein